MGSASEMSGTVAGNEDVLKNVAVSILIVK